jgi:UDP-2-acetamido-3-amino-2,3-dideoxy-glucuronate N-acetyltransferase
MGVYIDSLAQVSGQARLGDGTKVWSFSRVLERAVIGDHCQLGQNVFVDRDVVIGRRVKIQNNVSVYTGVSIADGVFLGPSCVFTNVTFPRAFIERKREFSPTVVERGVTVGANATIVCGVRLGEFSLVGAGSVVTRSTAPFSLTVGVTAERIGWVCACGKRLPAVEVRGAECGRCGLAYDIGAEGCWPAEAAAFERWWQGQMTADLTDRAAVSGSHA